MKIVADSEESIVRIPRVVKPIEIQIALRTIPVETGNTRIAISITPNGTNVQNIIYATTL